WILRKRDQRSSRIHSIPRQAQRLDAQSKCVGRGKRLQEQVVPEIAPRAPVGDISMRAILRRDHASGKPLGGISRRFHLGGKVNLQSVPCRSGDAQRAVLCRKRYWNQTQ